MTVLSFGEILLRLAAPGHFRLFQKDNLEATFCGSEANVAVSLSIFGLNSQFITKLPDNAAGHAALNSIRYFGVDISKVIYGEGRMGLYYLEKGASHRSSIVDYDRKYSAIAMAEPKDFCWNDILTNVDWFHWTGINPALSDNMIEICFEACQTARNQGITISCDLNYRGSLWSSERAQNVMKKLMPFVDVCIANEEDAYKVLGIKPFDTNITSGRLNKAGYIMVAESICRKYGCKYVAITLRKSYSASRNGWCGMLYSKELGNTFFSKEYNIAIVDRVGSGDSFAAGIIYSLIKGKTEQETVEFATAASCLKHTIEGDFNRTSVAEIEKLISSYGNGRIVR